MVTFHSDVTDCWVLAFHAETISNVPHVLQTIFPVNQS